MKRMDGKRTLVTGAAGPMGRGLVQSFLENGATVMAVDETDEEIEASIEALGLAESDDVMTRGLDEAELGSWWDLANLIAAFYDELDVFVHIPKRVAAHGSRSPRAIPAERRPGESRRCVDRRHFVFE